MRTLKRLGMRVAVVSGGFTDFTDWLSDQLTLDHAVANRLEVRVDEASADPSVNRAERQAGRGGRGSATGPGCGPAIAGKCTELCLFQQEGPPLHAGRQ